MIQVFEQMFYWRDEVWQFVMSPSLSLAGLIWGVTLSLGIALSTARSRELRHRLAPTLWLTFVATASLVLWGALEILPRCATSWTQVALAGGAACAAGTSASALGRHRLLKHECRWARHPVSTVSVTLASILLVLLTFTRVTTFYVFALCPSSIEPPI